MTDTITSPRERLAHRLYRRAVTFSGNAQPAWGTVDQTLWLAAADEVTAILADDLKTRVTDALREQASEARAHRNEPGYNAYDCDQNESWFGTVADWLNDNWDTIYPEGGPA